MNDADSRRGLVDPHTTAKIYRRDRRLEGLVLDQALARPDALALADERRSVSYGELASESRAVAHALVARGVCRGDVVGVLLPRGVDAVVAMLGILRAGAAYLPLDSAQPADRIRYMLADSRSRMTIVDEARGDHTAGGSDASVSFAKLLEGGRSEPGLRIGDVTDVAYVIYTSGSTGQPKGACIAHETITWLAQEQRDAVANGQPHRRSQFASLSFDAHVWEIWPALIAGGSVHFVPETKRADPASLIAWLAHERIEWAFVPTALAELCLRSSWPACDLKVLAVGGDRLHAVPPEIHSFVLLNAYGPTECTCVTTSIVIAPGEREPAIGRPLGGVRTYVLDRDLEPVPAGQSGELYVGGALVGRGYLARPSLTAETFLPDPFVNDRGARMYRTGDLVRSRADGVIEFIGRRDHQVKVRGFRIELGEVEAAVRAASGVEDVVVVAHDDRLGGKQLVAYVVPRLDVEALRRALARSLPEYMVPASLVVLDVLPLNASGKVDRSALPAPDLGADRPEYVAPRTELERRLCDAFASSLSLERVGLNDDFFALGGHSLLATRVASRVRSLLGIELPVRAIFEDPTVAKLAERVRPMSGAGSTHAALTRVDRSAPLRASFAQARLWFLDQLEGGGSATYNVPTILRLTGRVDVSALERAVQELVNRHEGLRTTFVAVEGVPHQVIHSSLDVRLTLLDAASEEQARGTASREAHTPFDLANGPLVRATLVKIGDEDVHLLVLCMHHIVTDGWSMVVLERELSALYGAFSEGKPSPLGAKTLDYADFAAWQRETFAEEALLPQLAFWRAHLAGAPPALELPTDRPRPAIKQHAGASVSFVVPSSVADNVRALCRREGVSAFMVLLAAYQCVLSRWSGQRDLVVGTVIANRTREELEDIIGFFVNTLAIRATLQRDTTFLTHLEHVKRTALAAHANQDVPFERVVEELGITRDPSRTPVFQAMLVLQNNDTERVVLPEVVVEHEESLALEIAQFDLTLVLTEDGNQFHGQLEYDVALFDRTTMERFADRFVDLLDGATRFPGERVARLPLMKDAERSALLALATHDTLPDAPTSLRVLFERSAATHREAVAVRDADGNALSYAELDAAANALARELRALGVGRDVRVAVSSERTLALPVAMLGVMKAGGVYVPVDVTLPTARRDFIIADSGARVAIVDRADRSIPDGVQVVVADPTKRSAPPVSGLPTDGRDAAVVLFTSGSTGTPKGVVLEHRSLASYASAFAKYVGLDAHSVTLAFASIGFDASIEEYFATWAVGGSLVLRNDAMLEPLVLADACERWGVSLLDLPTAYWLELWDALERAQRTWPKAVRAVVIGGEKAHPERVSRWNERSPALPRLINSYGPTETSIAVTWSKTESLDRATRRHEANIGRPAAHSRLYVLDDELDLVPLGVAGELFVGGIAVARGYLGRMELTAERFVPDPFSDVPGARMYRTGDLVRWRPDGTVEFLGRADDQVKIRGFRIEPGEVASALMKIPGVREAAVIARSIGDDLVLVAYLVADGDGDVVGRLRRELARNVPEYMVPAIFVRLEAMPVNASGKIDRRRLPDPPRGATLASSHVAPRTPLERQLCEVFATVLSLDRVGIHDDFFALGGHSLLATRVVSQIRSVLGVELRVRALFEHPTVARLAERLDAISTTSAVREPALVRVDRDVPQPASFAQARLWFLDQLEGGGSATYNVPNVLRLNGAVAPDVLERAVQELVARHEGLRTTFVAVDGVPHQLIHRAMDVRLHRVDAASEEEARFAAAREAHAPFDLAKGPLVRATLVRIREDAHLFVLCMHHIVTDGWSMSVLERELAAVYAAFVEGKPSPLLPPPIDYPDFAAWQRTNLRSEALAPQLAFWRAHLEGAPAALELPTDRPRPPVKQHTGASVPLVMSSTLAQNLRAFCRREGVTPFMALLATYQCVLSRWSGQRDVVVGTPIANRTRQELEGIVGFFVNTLAIRSTLERGDSFRDLLVRLKRDTLAAHAHQDVPFEKLVEELGVARDMSRTPVFQAMFVLQHDEADRLTLPGLTVVHDDTIGLDAAKFDVILAIAESGDRLLGHLLYDVALFDRGTMERFAAHLITFLDAATRSPEECVWKLPLMTEAETRRVVVEWNSTEHAVDGVGTVHAQFEAQARRTPARVAVEFEGRTLTYRELDDHADRVGHWLVEHGVRPGDCVAVEVSRSHEMLSALLGVMKAGAAYVPIDGTLPDDRKRFMKEDARANITVDDVALGEALSMATFSPPRIEVTPEQLAYVLYTSGSTGRPKGVMVAHANVVNLLASLAYEPGIDSDETTLSLTTLSFDVSVAELFLPILHGARVIVASREAARDPRLIANIIERTGARTFGATPATWRMMVESGWRPSAGMEIHCAGEALPRPLADSLTERGATLWNLYGPTEATVYASGAEIRRDAPITIGRPLRNTRLYIVDEDLRPLPIGVTGELLIAGAGVALGYLGRPGLTADKFIPDPFSCEPGARLYRTGDLARWRADGTVDFLGRRDHQVKVRGFRIELGEIEAAIRKVTGVTDGVVVARDDRSGGKRLVAYVVTRIDVGEIERELGRTLPDYMVPQAFVVLEALPVNPSGKVDRKALPDPDFAAAAEQYVAPRTELERQLCEIFASVLSLERVGVHDDFFAVGGHSLLATRLVSRIRSVMDVELPVRAVFEHPTVARLAQRLSEMSRSVAAQTPLVRVDRSVPVPASFAQARLWFLEQLEGGAATYNVPTVLRLSGHLDADVLEATVQELVRRHDGLRTTFTAIDGVPHQVVHPHIDLEVSRVDAGSEREARATAAREASAPFDLAKGPLVRATLVRIRDDAYIFVLCVHHIVTDGWSMTLLADELSAVYAALSEGRSSPLPVKELDYPDFAAWQRKALTDEVLAPQLAFWKAHLEGAPAALDLPTDRPRPAKKQYAGASVPFVVPEATRQNLRALCRSEGVTPFMVLLAAYQSVLARWSGQRDVVVGTVIANRTRHEVEDIVGFFVNTLAIRSAFPRDLSFTQLLAHVKRAALSAYAHQDVPFEKLVDELGVVRDLTRTPVFQAAFVLQNNETESVELPGVDVLHDDSIVIDAAKFDLTLAVAETGDQLRGQLEYDVALFDRSTIERYAAHFVSFLDHALRLPGDRVATVPLLGDAEKRFVLDAAASGDRVVTTFVPVHRRIEHHAQTRPAEVAIEGAGRVWSYDELNRRANRLARSLVRAGVGPESRVVALFERSADMVVGQLAILKAGAAYVPIDPSNPPARNATTVRDSGAALVLSTTAVASRALDAPVDVPLVLVDDVDRSAAIEREADGDLDVAASERHAAYVIYTSGSTGTPKGVVIEHGSLSDLAADYIDRMRLESRDRVTQIAGPAFDATTNETWPALVAGATLVILDDDTKRSPGDLVRVLREQRITVTYLPTALFEAARDEDWSGTLVRSCSIGGEALRRRPTARHPFGLVNLYGPTETTNYVTTEVVASGDEAITTIGRPRRGVSVYVLDGEGAPAPIGVYGEIHVGGAAVGRGYIGRPALTAEKFVPDPISGVEGARMYRTGDLGRWRPDGTLEFLGRRDGQVKIRGFRIEIGEVESALVAANSVSAAAVVARERAPGDLQLVAYVIPARRPMDIDALKAELRRGLPDYMLPGAFVVLDAFPLNSSGKVDRKALPAPDFTATPDDYVAPRTDLEIELCEIFASALSLDRVGIHDDFFALGGHSLLVARVVARIRDELGLDVSVADFFNAPTVALLAELLSDTAGTATSGRIEPAPPDAPPLPSYAQAMVLAWEEVHGPSPTWGMPRHAVLSGPLDVAALAAAVNDVLRNNEVLRTVFPSDGSRRVARILPFEPITLTPLDVDDRALADALSAEKMRPFDLDGEPFYRFKLFRLAPERHVLAWNIHQLVNDGLGEKLLVDQICTGYAARAKGEESPIEPPTIQYRDYVAWERARVAADSAGIERARARLRGAPVLDLPVDRPRNGKHSTRAFPTPITFSPEENAAIAAACRREATTRAVMMLAGLATVLGAASGQRDIVIGCPSSTRLAQAELERMIGRFTAPLLYRIELGDDPRTTLARAKESARAAQADAALPTSVVLDVDSPLDAPLVRVILDPPVEDPSADAPAVYADVEFEQRGIYVLAARVEITVYITDDVAGGLSGIVIAAADLYEPARIQKLIADLREAVMAFTRL